MVFFFFNDTATTEIYTLSLHDALPISFPGGGELFRDPWGPGGQHPARTGPARAGADPAGDRGAPAVCAQDRKSTRLNSSHGYISYAVFCLKKKNTERHTTTSRSVLRR